MTDMLKGRSLLTLKDFSQEEIRRLIDISHSVKKQKRNGEVHQRFLGKSIALLFEKRSTRTRCAFETAFGEEGGHPVLLNTTDIHLGVKESIEDTARVFGRMFDCIQFRGYKQETVELLARYSGVPVYNGLTDDYHPTQVLADLLTIEETLGSLKNKNLCYVGDGRNNMAVSLLIGCAKMGVNCTIVAPPSLQPSDSTINETLEIAKASGSAITATSHIEEGVAQADVIYTDIWISMGEESKEEERIRVLSSYQVNSGLMEMTGKSDTLFMHCLPAIKGNEVTDDVFESRNSVVWDEAENRKHTIKALMLATL
jgi:ornithine carbamoyltransferase